ncbi:response regulator transcription factor [Roseisolibacter agri]|uniref:response regulator transcription factor n=1 Tax=Roseisolibacter agri TaxID=2014610 RepID=UPI0024E06043|nr:response regulator transcription factor [Roseisolibacter agri]
MAAEATRARRVRPLPLLGADAPTTPPAETSILVVAEHALMRAGLRAVLGGMPGFVVVAEAPDLPRAAALARQVRPAVVLVSTPPRDAADHAAVARVRAETPGVCVLCLGDAGGEADGRAEGGDRTPPDGAVMSIPNDAGVVELCATVGALLDGGCAACALRAHCPMPRLVAALSRRERQVAVRVAAGLTSKQIAGALGIGLRTVNTYRESLARKVGGSSPAILTRYVIACGLDGATGPDPGVSGLPAPSSRLGRPPTHRPPTL